MAKKPAPSSQTSKAGAAKPLAKAAPVIKGATPDAPKRPFNPVQFVNEVRAEARKMSWTSRQETWITSVMVFIMVVLTALFFVVVDSILGTGMQAILKFAS